MGDYSPAKPIMVILGALCRIALIVLLILIIIEEVWWYALIMFVVGFVLGVVIPLGERAEYVVAHLGIVLAPLFVVLGFVSLYA